MARASPRARGKAKPGASASLERYWAKRDFTKTSEPRGEKRGQQDGTLSFVIQKHDASRLHYDFRLELDGVMLSWAVPKGPSYDPKIKRLAVQTEDHPISYNSFEGTIPKGQYGAGKVIIWDRGTWEPVGDPRRGIAEGKVAFTLHGEKMHGLWELVRIRQRDKERQVPWLLFKKHDSFERSGADYDVISALPDSVVRKPLTKATRPGKDQRRSKRVAPATRDTEIPRKAVKAALPGKLSPQLATLASEVPSAGEWIYEVKFDGYRILARIANGKPRLFTRRGHDWSAKMPVLVEQLASMDIRSAWLDGEVVVMDEEGIPRFNALQNAFDQSKTRSIQYFLFDVPYFEGHDLRQLPLRERRALLEELLDARGTPQIHFSAAFEAGAAEVLQSACRLKLEGVIAKLADSPYVSQRTETWLKLKCSQRQEFVIAGFTDRKGVPGAAEIGSLLLGIHDEDGNFISVGSVGTGWNSKTAADLKKRLLKLEIKAPPFTRGAPGRSGRWSRRPAARLRWVKPQLVAEVSFTEWTDDDQLRHASFEGLRNDKPAKAITRESVVVPSAARLDRSSAGADVSRSRRATRNSKAASGRRASKGATVTGNIGAIRSAGTTKVTHPERIIDSTTGLTKLDLVRYYESVAEWMVPHLKGRPCSLLRGPSGIGGQLFFQKHLGKLRIPEVRELDPSLWPEHEPLIEVPTAKAIAAAAQMNVIEFHTWNSTTRNIDKPNRIVFDLDPGKGVKWKALQEGAALTRSLLQQLGLEAWLKTSGGKGLHVVVPIAPRYAWETVRAFAKAVVEQLARVIPDRFVAKSGPSNRVGKIYVDYLRNGYGATTVAAYSARARPGLGVSMPVPWDELEELESGAHWTIANAREHLSFQKADPWEAYWSSRQTLARAMKALGVKKKG